VAREEEGWVLLSADYSQIELRLMAHMSRDPQMLEDFGSDLDIHAATAARVYRIPPDRVTPDMRRKAKMVNFGIIYGISAFGLSQRLGVGRGEAADLIKQYFGIYPKVQAYMQECVAEARSKGYAETLMGRRRTCGICNPTTRPYGPLRNAMRSMRRFKDRPPISSRWR